ncbi:MAG: hypothetical protein AAF264_07345 [Pseudomonadota bacterium]
MDNDTFARVLDDLLAISLPVPDLILVLGAIVATALAIALARLSSGRRQARAVSEVSNAYVEELRRANRKAQSAEAKLAKAKSDLERTRRRAR